MGEKKKNPQGESEQVPLVTEVNKRNGRKKGSNGRERDSGQEVSGEYIIVKSLGQVFVQ